MAGEIVISEKLTEGAACTSLLAKNLINNNQSLLIANSDQIIEWNSDEFMYFFQNNCIFSRFHPPWLHVGFALPHINKRGTKMWFCPTEEGWPRAFLNINTCWYGSISFCSGRKTAV